MSQKYTTTNCATCLQAPAPGMGWVEEGNWRFCSERCKNQFLGVRETKETRPKRKAQA